MSRLFVGSRDIQFVNDITKEVLKDVIGQKIYYYAISTMATKVNKVYNESPNKIFEKPIALDVLIGQPQWAVKDDRFGIEQMSTLEVLIQARDLIDKKISPNEGDYFTYGDVVFEVVSYLNLNNIFGQEEYECAYKIVGKQARPGEFDPAKIFSPRKDTGVPLEHSDEVQKVFEQQRGFTEDSQGKETGDVREVRQRLGEEMAPAALGEGPRRVEPDETKSSTRFKYD
jgi:hypothetical protein